MNMGKKPFMNAGLLFAVTVLSFASPAVAAAQGTGIGVSVQGAIGSHIGDGGDAQSVSLGVWFGEHFGVVVNAERSYVPTDVTFIEGGYSTTRGATTRFISGEFRYVPVTYKRIAPYVIAGVGRGVSRPNVNEYFPDRVTHTVMLQFPGVGVRVLVTDHLSAFADFRAMFQSRRGEPDAGGFVPVRGGLAWRF
jgi:hypothetical protein